MHGIISFFVVCKSIAKLKEIIQLVVGYRTVIINRLINIAY